MPNLYYRVVPKAHPDQMGVYVLHTEKGLEVLTGTEDEIAKHGLKFQQGALRCSSDYLVQEVSKAQADKAREESDNWLVMQMWAGVGVVGGVRTDGGKNFVGGLH